MTDEQKILLAAQRKIPVVLHFTFALSDYQSF